MKMYRVGRYLSSTKTPLQSTDQAARMRSSVASVSNASRNARTVGSLLGLRMYFSSRLRLRNKKSSFVDMWSSDEQKLLQQNDRISELNVRLGNAEAEVACLRHLTETLEGDEDDDDDDDNDDDDDRYSDDDI
jgi:hypothetical protein